MSLRGAKLLIGDVSFERDELTALYRSPDFPLPRKGDIQRSRARRARNRRTAQTPARVRTSRNNHAAMA